MKILKTIALMLALALIELACVNAFAEEPKTPPPPKEEVLKPELPKGPFEVEGMIVLTPSPTEENHLIVWQ